MRVLLTGMSGAGKSTLVEELRRRGHTAYDADDHGFAEPRGDGGRWGWRADAVADLLAREGDGLLFFSGASEEQAELPFDYRVLLTAPRDVLVERLRTRRTNPYGRDERELAQVLEDLDEVEPLLRRSADLVLTTTAPAEELADRLLTAIVAAETSAGFRAPAEAYDRFVGRYGAELGRALMDFAGVRPGLRVLDVGAGPGALTAELAARVGLDAVAAVEPSPVFAAACRERVPGVLLHEAGAEALPFPDDAFDAALAQLVVNFIPDPLRGLGEMARVTRAGGTVAAAVWDYAGEMTLLRTFWDAAVALDPAAAQHDEGRRGSLGTPEGLRDLWTEVGLDAVETGAATLTAAYADVADLWAPFEQGVGPAGRYTAGLAADERAELRDEVRRRLGVADGPFALTARAWLVRGRPA